MPHKALHDSGWTRLFGVPVELHGEICTVQDLESANGTFHNGAKLVGAKLLHPGDRIQVGTTLIEAQ